MPEGQAVHIKQFGNDRLGDLLPEVRPDKLLFPGEFGVLGQAARGSAKPLPLGFPAGECLGCPRGDHGALDLSRQGEGKSEDFGIDIVPDSYRSFAV